MSQADVGEPERPAGPRDAEGAAQATLGGPASLRPAGGGAPQGAWLGLPTEGRGRGAEGRGVGHVRGQRGRSGVAGRPREGGGAGPPGGVSLACGCRAETGLSLIAFIFVCFLFLLLTSGLLLLLLCPPLALSPALRPPPALPCAPTSPASSLGFRFVVSAGGSALPAQCLQRPPQPCPTQPPGPARLPSTGCPRFVPSHPCPVVPHGTHVSAVVKPGSGREPAG